MRRLAQVLPNALGRGDEVLRRARAQALLRRWDEIVGEGLAKRSRPDRYGNGTVWVAVEGSAWAQELRLRKETILARLRELSGESSLFHDIRFGVRPLPLPDAELQAEPAESAEPLPRDTEMTIEEIVARRQERQRARDAEGA